MEGLESPATSPGATGAATLEDRAPQVWVAGLWRRAAAGLLDAALLVPVCGAVVWMASRLAGLRLPPLSGGKLDAWLDLLLAGDPAVLGVLGLAAAIAAVYLICFQVLGARTPGMRVLGLRIIDVYGEPPSALRALARTLGYFVAAATAGLGFVWIGFDREKRGLHDWLSGTYVIKPQVTRPPPGRPRAPAPLR